MFIIFIVFVTFFSFRVQNYGVSGVFAIPKNDGIARFSVPTAHYGG
jgi:hypothetical protein